MIGIFILEKANGISKAMLASEISALIPSILITNERAKIDSEKTAKFLVTTFIPQEITLENSIIIAWENTLVLPKTLIPSTLLLCGERKQNISHTGDLITIGLGARDTINLSSMNDDRAVISVQRPLVDCYKNMIEPMEFPIKVHKSNHLDYMAIYTTALLCGWRPKEI